ncbi:hypothetical protein G6F59_014969 [Rhizopus arrhizus]|nr:hypothetical protein G6F59_014969 [Rhizopus arrhizus]
MRAVHHAQLQPFVGRGIAHEGRAAVAFPSRPARRELVFDDPVHIGLAHHRPGILHAQALGEPLPVIVAGSRHDAVDHGIREGAMRVDPVRQPHIHPQGKGQHQAAQARVRGAAPTHRPECRSCCAGGAGYRGRAGCRDHPSASGR